MKNKSFLRETLVNKLDMPAEIIYDVPLIKIIGTGEIIVENHKGIVEYTNEMIRLSSSIGIIVIRGSGILINKIDESIIDIEGEILSVEYVK